MSYGMMKDRELVSDVKVSAKVCTRIGPRDRALLRHNGSRIYKGKEKKNFKGFPMFLH
jgi:predicted Fe-Mo cluster-binding NifX family protein